MAKHRRGGRAIQGGNGKSITVDGPLPLLGVVLDTREAFHELCIRTGREVLLAMMEADREALCGPKGKHQNPWGQSSRHRRSNVQAPNRAFR